MGQKDATGAIFLPFRSNASWNANDFFALPLAFVDRASNDKCQSKRVKKSEFSQTRAGTESAQTPQKLRSARSF
jgi:hypothetical protein